MMDIDQLGDFMDLHLGRAAFRLETLQQYEVDSDGSDFRRYLDGALTWTPERKEPWLAHLRNEAASGVWRHRVRVITHPITDYTRYECEWGYAPNGEAGEGIRILDLAERDMPDIGALSEYDWWLLTDTEGVHRVAVMHYADDGQFLGATTRDRTDIVRDFAAARDLLWNAAEPFAPWWGRHGELHRQAA